VRKSAALIVAFGMLLGLTACSGTAAASDCSTSVTSGDASSVITAKGKFSTQPTINFPTPVVTKTTERTELLPGDGAPLQDGQPALLDLTLLDGATGAVLTQTGYDGIGGSLVTVGPSTFPALSLGLKCATVGSRVAIVGSAKDTHQGQANESAGVGANDSFVFVVDILRAFPAKADGASQIAQEGMPSVVLAPNGTPGITILNEQPPKSLKVAALQVGHGQKVAAGDYVVMKSTGVLWDGKTVFESTWKDGPAVVNQMVKSDTVVEGLVKGLVGQRVGSQMLIVVPPALGFGSQGSSSVPADSTLVYVVDILGIIPHSK